MGLISISKKNPPIVVKLSPYSHSRWFNMPNATVIVCIMFKTAALYLHASTE